MEQEVTMFEIEEWWRHNGCWDRQLASGIRYDNESDYLDRTDNWWEGLTDEEKRAVYEDFFAEY